MKFLGIDLIRFVHLLAMLVGKRAMRLCSVRDAISTWKAFGYVEKDNFYDKGGSKRCLYGMHEMQELQGDDTIASFTDPGGGVLSLALAQTKTTHKHFLYGK